MNSLLTCLLVLTPTSPPTPEVGPVVERARAQAAEIQRLIGQLGSPRAGERDAASTSLARIGSGCIEGVASSPDGRRPLSCGRDGTIRLWRTSGGV